MKYEEKKSNKHSLHLASHHSGSMLVFSIIVMFIFSLVMISALSYATAQMRLLRSTIDKEQAFQIAEAGVNYYQWHLAHFPSDYADGTGASCSVCGPFVKDYIDTDTGVKIGEYSLTITPPLVGSTVVTIQSTGYTLSNPKIKRTVTARYGIPSLAKYAFLTNSDAWIGNSENISGEFHTNGGVRFDGTGNAPVYSSKTTYTCVSTFGCSPSQTKPGIWGSAPSSTQAFWQFPVPNVDFSTMTSDLAGMKSNAQSGGIYLPPSNAQGYSLVFNSNGTITIYRVTSLRAHQSGTDVAGNTHNEDLDYNARTQVDGNSSLAGTQAFAMPTNGVIYIEDKTWVEGTINGRALVAAARLPYNANTAPSIIIPGNIVYLAKDGTHSLGLLAQQDVLISYFAPDNLEVDAALIAQNGSTERFFFSGNIKNSITIYGSLASFGVWTWSWVSGSVITSGYQTTNTVYDSNLLYSPPPSFPLTTNGYQQVNWKSN